MKIIRLFILLMVLTTLSIHGFAGHEKDETISIQGTVIDESGEPLAGVAIRVQGYASPIYTDLDGNFTVLVPKSGKLNALVSTISYKEKQVELDAEGTIKGDSLKIALEPNGGI